MGRGSNNIKAARRTCPCILRHGSIKAYARNPQERNRFKWVVGDHKYIRNRCTPGEGPAFVVIEGESWLDVGANVGFFALLCFQMGAAHVTCVEAERDNIACLRKNLEINGHNTTRAKVVRALVRGSSNKSAQLLLSRKTTRHSVLRAPEAIPSGGVQPIPVVQTLQKFLRMRPYHGVKLNIEGAEREVLLAMKANSWPRSVKKLVVEYSFDVFPHRRDYDTLCNHLESTGWRIYPESVPAWFKGKNAQWDRRKTMGNDARQIWAFRCQ